MQDRIRELTERLYNEGIEAGKSQAEQVVLDAKNSAQKILDDAKLKAKEITQEAEHNAELKRKQVMSEIQLASQKAITALKQKIATVIETALFDTKIDESMKDVSFLQKMILATLESWSSTKGESMDLTIYVAKNNKADIEKFIAVNGKEFLDRGCEIILDNDIKSGFKIGPKDRSYVVEFSEDSFKSFFKAYIKPQMYEVIFKK